MNRDFDYYIMAAEMASQRSRGLWRGACQMVMGALKFKKENSGTLDEVAECLERISGAMEKDEPVYVSNLRVAARQIRARGELALI